MKEQIIAAALARVLVCVALVATSALTGCTMIVSPNISSSDFLTTEEEVPGTIHLYVSEHFKNYTQDKTDISDMKEWHFELGEAATDAFRFAFESRFSDVKVRLGDPAFPIENDAHNEFFVVVSPEFVSFKAYDPVVFKFEQFKVETSIRVDAYDTKGEKLFSEVYAGTGVKRGSIGYQSAGMNAYPVATELALEEIVNEVVSDIHQLFASLVYSETN